MSASQPLEKRPVVCVVLDGWGWRTERDHNPIAEAKTPCFDALWNEYPHGLLDASGVHVGLPEGQMGNSEIGHMVIGSGMKIPTDLVRIQHAIDHGEMQDNPVLSDIFAHVRRNASSLHVMGLLGPGGVHAHQDHLLGLLRAAKQAGVERVYIHGFTDGRDTPPQSAAGYVQELERELRDIGIGQIATVCGRFYAMDRDRNWERIAVAERAIFLHEGRVSSDAPSKAIKAVYARDRGDEHLEPLLFLDVEGKPFPAVTRGDAIFFFNFRADRAVQLSRRILERTQGLDVAFATMTSYADDLPCPVVFPSFVPPVTLAGQIAAAGYTQAHIAETEKYAHATYFFNGGRTTPHDHEEHVLIESRKVLTHDLAPEMRAQEITDAAIERLARGAEFLFMNYANADMVGHTANHPAIIAAIEALDVQIGRLADAVRTHGGSLCLTADHGNAEVSFDPSEQHRHTAHTSNLVPVIVMSPGLVRIRSRGTLADVAPTTLDLMGLVIPSQMTGVSLLSEVGDGK